MRDKRTCIGERRAISGKREDIDQARLIVGCAAFTRALLAAQESYQNSGNLILVSGNFPCAHYA